MNKKIFKKKKIKSRELFKRKKAHKEKVSLILPIDDDFKSDSDEKINVKIESFEDHIIEGFSSKREKNIKIA